MKESNKKEKIFTPIILKKRNKIRKEAIEQEINTKNFMLFLNFKAADFKPIISSSDIS